MASASAIAIMPARGGSKRIEYKNIVDFCGKPLLVHALDAARESGLFDLIHVSTDDDRIAETAAAAGFPPEFRRDPALADDHTPLMPVLKWVLEQFSTRGRPFETVCLLMPTAPLIDAGDLRGAHALYHQHGGARTVWAVADFPCPVEWALRRTPEGQLTAIQPGMAAIRSQDLPKAYYESGTFGFLPATHVLGAPGPAVEELGYVLPRHKAVDIDNPDDLELAERLFRGGRAAATRPG
jgi:N-acylneuraminate cytidylyltransferase